MSAKVQLFFQKTPNFFVFFITKLHSGPHPIKKNILADKLIDERVKEKKHSEVLI